MNTLQERLRNLWLDAGRQTREEAADRIDALERENFALAAGQCPEVIGDEGGTPRCKRIAALEAENAALLALLKRAAPLLEDYAEYANTAPIWHATGGTADAVNPLVAEVNAAIARSKT